MDIHYGQNWRIGSVDGLFAVVKSGCPQNLRIDSGCPFRGKRRKGSGCREVGSSPDQRAEWCVQQSRRLIERASQFPICGQPGARRLVSLFGCHLPDGVYTFSDFKENVLDTVRSTLIATSVARLTADGVPSGLPCLVSSRRSAPPSLLTHGAVARAALGPVQYSMRRLGAGAGRSLPSYPGQVLPC